MGGWRFAGIFFVSLLGGSLGALILSPEDLTVGASGAVFGLMAAGFIEARDRGMNDVASQIGFYVIINLIFTFSVPNISIGGHLGGMVAGGVLTLLLGSVAAIGRRRRIGPLEMGAIVALGAALAVACVVAGNAAVPPGFYQQPRRNARPAGASASSGWRRCARSSTPSTRRGPGRENDEAASTAQIASAPSRLELAGCVRAPAPPPHRRRGRTASRRRRRPRRRGAPPTSPCADLTPASPSASVPPGDLDHLGHPVAADERRVEPLERDDARPSAHPRPRVANRFEASTRAHGGGARRARARRIRRPAGPGPPSTSSSVSGSSESTSGSPGRPPRSSTRRRRRRRRPRRAPASRSGRARAARARPSRARRSPRPWR